MIARNVIVGAIATGVLMSPGDSVAGFILILMLTGCVLTLLNLWAQ